MSTKANKPIDTFMFFLEYTLPILLSLIAMVIGSVGSIITWGLMADAGSNELGEYSIWLLLMVPTGALLGWPMSFDLEPRSDGSEGDLSMIIITSYFIAVSVVLTLVGHPPDTALNWWQVLTALMSLPVWAFVWARLYLIRRDNRVNN